MMEQLDQPPPPDRWKNRRKMAWTSLIAGLAYPVLLLVTDSDQLGAVAGPFYIFVGAVVGAYVGFATLDDRWSHEYRYDQPSPRLGSYRRPLARGGADDSGTQPVGDA